MVAKQRAEPLEPATVSVKRPTATEKDDEEHAKSKPKLGNDKVKEELENATTSGDNVPVSPSPETLAASAIPMLTERPVTVSESDDLRAQVAELTRRQAEAPAASAGPWQNRRPDSGWVSRKAERAARHQAGGTTKPQKVTETPYCQMCSKNQPGGYCPFKLCRRCCREDGCPQHH